MTNTNGLMLHWERTTHLYHLSYNEYNTDTKCTAPDDEKYNMSKEQRHQGQVLAISWARAMRKVHAASAKVDAAGTAWASGELSSALWD